MMTKTITCLIFCLSTLAGSNATSVRLRGMHSTAYKGRVEVLHNGIWGTVCDDSWTDDDASVICRMLHFRKGGKAFINAHFGEGSGQIWLDDVNCTLGYTVTDISNCHHRAWGTNNCGHSEDAGVECMTIDIRLMNGNSDNEGRIEVYHGSSWGTICDDGWSSDSSRVACRQLGYRDYSTYYSGAHYGQGKGAILMDNVRCPHSVISRKIWNCSFPGWGVHNCNHDEDVGVKCVKNAVRLVNGYGGYSGRLEILQSGRWGTVCDDSFGDEEASVVCRMLGYNFGKTLDNEVFGSGTGTIQVDGLDCSPSYTRPIHALMLGDTLCSFNGWGINDCSHSEDVGVICSPNDCDEGKFGYHCQHRCHCKVPGCNSTTGVCDRRGCIPGWTGTTCSDVCPSGTFGEACQRNCHCRSSGCDPVTGVCSYQSSGCLAGWKGERCDQACDVNTFGSSCRQRCHCKIPGCDKTTGTCEHRGCLPGWRGSSCSLGCLSGTFGEACQKNCHCRSYGCNPVTGICIRQSSGCSTGWKGERCDQECDVNTFGNSCAQRCHCKTPGCYSGSGTCKHGGCLPGWRGSSCSQVCLSGTFGEACSSRCHCWSSGCDPVTGNCTYHTNGCLAGWKGDRCDQACDDDKYGFSCSRRCHCKLPGCNSITGVCKRSGCLPGWRGENCHTACSSGTFGQSCSSRCHCKSSGCDPVTGVCTNQTEGCLDGWRGERCDEACYPGQYGKSCSLTCHCACGCDPISGICRTTDCLGEWKGSNCNHRTSESSMEVKDKDKSVPATVLGCLLALTVLYAVGVSIKLCRKSTPHPHRPAVNSNPDSDTNRGLFAIALPRQGGMQDIGQLGQPNVAFHGAQVDIHFDGIPKNLRNNYNNRH